MYRHELNDPMSALVDMIKFAVAKPVHSAGGSDRDVNQVAVAAAYAAWCWGSAAVFDTVPPKTPITQPH